MEKNNVFAKTLLILAGLGFISVAVQAFYDPQLVMNAVETELTNNSARNSIRANYGGMNMALGGYLVYAAFKKQATGLLLLALYTGGFFVGRIAGLYIDGAANSFVHSWTLVELFFSMSSLWLLRRRKEHLSKALDFVPQA